MKADLDRLMAGRELQAVVVVGDELYSAERDYLGNGARVTGGLVIKLRGAAPVMIVNPMEIEEARSSGLEAISWQELDWAQLLQEAEGDRERALAGLWGRALQRLDVPPGRIGIYGTAAAQDLIELLPELQALEGYEFCGERGMTLFDEAAMTRDADELERIRRVAAGTNATLRATWDFIAGHRAQDELVTDDAGRPLTIGALRRFIRRILLDHDLEDTGMILAQGRDAGFPHSRGQDDQPLRCGQTLVFDLFPREYGGGYHHDVTRTWCPGHVPAEIAAAHETVLRAFKVALDAYAEPGQPAGALQEAVLDYFESAGHPTPRSHPGTDVGYVHSLGHGLGLAIHERPSLSHLGDDRLQVGNVFSIEPGLYYPQRGYGLRVEDTVFIDGDGTLQTLTDFHKHLLLPLQD